MDLKLNISQDVRKKLTEKHGVKISEIRECFSSRTGGIFADTREEHRSNPPTLWFVSSTDYGRLLKIVFIFEIDKSVTIRSAFEPNAIEMRLYAKLNKPK